MKKLRINELTKNEDKIISFIGETRILKKNGELESVEVFKERSNVVFDSKTKNFHVFPKSKDKREEIALEMNALHKSLVENIDKVLQESSLENYEIIGKNSKGNMVSFNVYNNLSVRSCPEDNQLYKYIGVKLAGKTYYIIYRRFNTSGDKINCDFNLLQYECISDFRGCINVCKDAYLVCYPESAENGVKGIIKSGDGICQNISYNPPISFYRGEDKTQSEHAVEILWDFVKFIEECENPVKL